MTPRRSWGLRPGLAFRVVRRTTQALALLAIVLGPFLGGWQRLDRTRVAEWAPEEPHRIMVGLPTGSKAARAHDLNLLKGGGSGVDYFEVPVADPVGGVVALLALGEVSLRTVIAWCIPVLIGLVAGRVFCGWFCPFGTLARALEAVLARLPWQPPRFTPPPSRPLRFVLLLLGVLLGAAGFPLMLYFFLPYVLLQQSIYFVWLLGGGGAALGALLGLIFVGVLVGPTTYCAAVCPTGGAFALVGRARVVRLRIVEPKRCGAHCDLCTRACWIDLTPHTGDPGPDCDVCGRCAVVCPKDNLHIAPAPPRVPARVPVRVVSLVLLSLIPATGEAQVELLRADDRPRLRLEVHQQRQDVDIKLALVDMSGVHLDADDPREERGAVLSVYLARGPAGAVDERGRMDARPGVYRGPLRVSIENAAGERKAEVAFEGPGAPVSTPRRSIYRGRIAAPIEPGDRVVLDPIAGWLEVSEAFVVPESLPGSEPWRAWVFFLATVVLFGGAILVALGWGRS